MGKLSPSPVDGALTQKKITTLLTNRLNEKTVNVNCTCFDGDENVNLTISGR